MEDLVTSLKGVGGQLSTLLAGQGVRTVGDLLQYWPRRYEDFSHLSPIGRLKPGQVTIEAKVLSVSGRYVRRGLHITEAVASDSTGNVRLSWFNQPYRASAIKKGAVYFISGDFGWHANRLSVQNPHIELASDFPVSTARIVPIYRETKHLKSHQIRKLLREVFNTNTPLTETLPEWVLESANLMSYDEAVRTMHFPRAAADLQKAKKRLAFEEIFGLTLAALLNKEEQKHSVALQIPFVESIAQAFVSELAFKLTDAQKKIVWQIYKDMQKSEPMNRLVEGDVGSGKTVVAAMSALMVMAAGFQVAVMVPTEILARQHAETMRVLLEHSFYAKKIGLLLGSMPAKQKSALRAGIKHGNLTLIIGTQALIQDSVDMHRLGLVIVDEQHRFGVDQRQKLQIKAGHMPHVLHMTATPIPRTLALTLYGELDISILDALPPGRKPVITKLWSPNSRQQLYVQVDELIGQGRQVFVVCPLISESEQLSCKAAEKIYEELKQKWFKHRRIGLLHGRMKADAKEATMQAFIDHQIDILVSTTVIEVGVNVPNATVMIIEGPERFGLAQMHQLRGRIARGEYQGYCFLLLSDSKAPSKRLRALEHITDGFELAELDLSLRGPGAIYGTRQSGQLDLRIASLTDVKLIATARSTAQAFLDKGENLLQYPQLASRVAANRAVTNLN